MSNTQSDESPDEEAVFSCIIYSLNDRSSDILNADFSHHFQKTVGRISKNVRHFCSDKEPQELIT